MGRGAELLSVAAKVLPVDRALAGTGRLRARLLRPAIARLAGSLDPDVVPFIVLTSHRTGSNLLVSLLGDHPRVAVAGEVLSRHVPLDEACPGAASWEQLRPARLLHDHVFDVEGVDAAGCKVFYHHGAGFSRSAWVYLDHLSDLRVVHLRRRDRLARYVSYLRAMDDGIWVSSVEVGHRSVRRVTVDPDAFRAHVELWDRRRRAAFDRLGTSSVLEIWFEDLVADRPATLARVFAHLEVAPVPVSSPLQRQRVRPLEDVVADHDRVVEAVAPIRWEPDDHG